MKTGKYEIVVMWYRPEEEGGSYTDILECENQESAEEYEKGIRTVFGNQIQWSCVRPQYAK